ncbi:type VII secretion integral membrane protein EccD [Actinoalloteichus sp. AHMU CJ021]|uniref:Type VII secretion integral membrane protein EccD n=1 Tax=Actinoalloteichus caeruleus DSM 43889 TaxID=1120930 RepID=A0ABT1JP52_ACTCY|nr:type VII secretion integral membrane protein EccD [Actinoalloteichus caeruleus]AUS79207.1 type VII secretion integral membrane protein EccD [Actinoalloteichus sp. AHMU CJ021]MCP2333461.1 type VII secretion integral membrane protein EccD [Actinoalloteichus caeruleus DSM 43889]
MATGTTVFSRVTVVAPKTRIDLALPADVAVADLLPMLLEMSKEATPDGGARHGGWCLAKMGEGPLDPSRTLASLGVLDGEIVQLRRRSENPPPPLYDDVVDAISDSDPLSFRPWTKETAHRLGHIAGVLALVVAAVALFVSGRSLGSAITATVTAVVAVAAGAVVTRAYRAPRTGLLIAAAGGLPMAFVGGLYLVPGGELAPSFLLGSALVTVFASASVMLLGQGVVVFVAAGAAGALGALTFLVGTFVDHPPSGIAAGAAAVSLAALSILPRLTIYLAKLPLPQVPGSAEDLKEDTGFPDYAIIEQRSGLAHEYMTGMIIGCGVVAAIGAVIAAGSDNFWGPVLGVVVSIVLLLRSRTYANGTQAIALLMCGMLTAAGLVVGWMTATDDQLVMLLGVFGTLMVLAVAAFVLGVVFPDQKFSPVLRRSVDIFEAVMIAAVIPVALAVMELYTTFRQLIQIEW